MMNEVGSILTWWLVLMSLGLMFLPLAEHLFQSFIDKGYIFAKILGLAILSYISWLLASLHLVPFSSASLYLLIILLTGINLLLIVRRVLKLNLIPNWKIYLFEEVLFFLGLLFWLYVRSFEPSIHGLEKFMDFGFINSILQSNFFPPLDLWLTPHTINYYYFGHLTVAVLIKLAGVLPEIGYNLTLATIFGICLTSAFSIGANLFSRFHPGSLRLTLMAGGISSFIVTLGGNLHPIYAFFESYIPAEKPLPFWELTFKLNFGEYWYPNATRFIENTIHEFPLYSFVVADLHGHVLNIPFVLLFIALTIATFQLKKLTSLHYLLLAFLVGIFLMTNVLDGVIYLLFTIIIIIAKRSARPWQELSLIILLSALFSLPYWLSFKPFGHGIGVLCAPDFLINYGKIGPFLFEADHCARSPVWMLLVLWGFFIYIVAGFLLLVVKGGWRKIRELGSADHLCLTLGLIAFILILVPEIFYAKDIYPAHYRANTVFKFGYQAFMILGLISGYLITRILTTVGSKIYLSGLIILFFLVAIYPYFAIGSYYQQLKGPQTLDGLKYLNDAYPDDYQAILWLRENISGQPVILEAQGDSYTDYARVSANTGLPTVLGWPVHEWLWRGSYDVAGDRIPNLSTLYESEDLVQTQELIKNHNIKYIFVGSLERDKYPELNEEKLAKLGSVIFQSGETRIYQLNSN